MLHIIIIFFTIFSQSHSKKERLIIGGKNVPDIKEFPHSVFILFTCPGKLGTWLCGGSVLTQKIFLTAGHCLNTHCEMKIEIVAGSEDISKEKSIIRKIVKYYRHQYYDDHGSTSRNDIALLAAKVDLPLGRNIKRVMVEKEYPHKAFMAAVAGWGRTSDLSTNISKTLKYVRQIIKPVPWCEKELSESLWPGQMCATNDKKNYPTTHDSGCALVTGYGQQIGIVSFRIPTKPEVVVYTNVSHFYPWIKKHVRHLSCSMAKLASDKTGDDYYGEDPNAVDK